MKRETYNNFPSGPGLPFEFQGLMYGKVGVFDTIREPMIVFLQEDADSELALWT